MDRRARWIACLLALTLSWGCSSDDPATPTDGGVPRDSAPPDTTSDDVWPLTPDGTVDATETPADLGADGSVAPPQSWPVGRRSRKIDLPGGGELPFKLRYPAVAPGGTAVPVAAGKFPVVVFGHGYQQTFADYEYLASALASAGYIVALAAKRGSALTIPIDDYAAELALLLQRMQDDGATTGSVWHGHVAPKGAIGGHSTGGGASYLAARRAFDNKTFVPTALVTLAPLAVTGVGVTGTPPKSIVASIGAPSLILEGGKDCITPSKINSQVLYDGLASADKHLVRLVEGDHCGFSDEAGPGQSKCELGEGVSCGVSPQGTTLPVAEQNALTVKIVLPWLDHQLKGRAGALAAFEAALADARVSFQAP